MQWLVGVHFSAPTFTPTIEISKRSDDASYYTIIVLSLNCVFMVYLSFVDFHVLLLTYCILPGQSFSFVFDGEDQINLGSYGSSGLVDGPNNSTRSLVWLP